MSSIAKIMGIHRPYPLDRERRRRVLVLLAEKDMSISDLSRSLKTSRAIISQVINGRRLSSRTEKIIADYLGKPVDYLFPPRSIAEMLAMQKGKAA